MTSLPCVLAPPPGFPLYNRSCHLCRVQAVCYGSAEHPDDDDDDDDDDAGDDGRTWAVQRRPQ